VYLAEGVQLVEQQLGSAGGRMSQTLLLGLLAEAQLTRGRRNDAVRALAAAFTEMEATGQRFFFAGLHALGERLA
jgi:hypothetical protein